MSFFHVFGGDWMGATAPTPELIEKWKKQSELLQYSTEYQEKCAAQAAEGAQATAYLKDLGEGKFSAGMKWKDISYDCEFELGKPAKITGDTDGKEMSAVHTFMGGKWTTIITREGAPEMKVERHIEGDIMHQKETVGDLVVDMIAKKAPAATSE